MWIRKYAPNFMTGFDEPDAEWHDLDSLKKVPFVARWLKGENFARLSVSNDLYLMAEHKDGRYWVIGIFLNSHEKLGLPIWVEPALRPGLEQLKEGSR